MKRQYEAPAVEVLEMGVISLLEESQDDNRLPVIDDETWAPGEAW